MTEYLDIRAGDDVDPFARDVRPLEAYAQDVYHGLTDDPWIGNTKAFGLSQYVGKPLPSTLAGDIETWARNDDRAQNAACTITPTGEPDSYRFELKIEVESGFLRVALDMTPSGIARVA